MWTRRLKMCMRCVGLCLVTVGTHRDIHRHTRTQTDWRCVNFIKDTETASVIKSVLIQAMESHSKYNPEPCPLEKVSVSACCMRVCKGLHR